MKTIGWQNKFHRFTLNIVIFYFFNLPQVKFLHLFPVKIHNRKSFSEIKIKIFKEIFENSVYILKAISNRAITSFLNRFTTSR